MKQLRFNSDHAIQIYIFLVIENRFKRVKLFKELTE